MAKEIQFILYNLPDNSGTVQAYVEDKTNEMTLEATIKKNLIVQPEGNRQVKREQTFYPLDAIISVGYRVNSQRATLFRQWATKILNEFIRKGFVLDDERLKQGVLYLASYGKVQQLVGQFQEIVYPIVPQVVGQF